MTTKKILSAVLLVFVAVSVVYLLANELSTKSSVPVSSPDSSTSIQNSAADSSFGAPVVAGNSGRETAKNETLKTVINKPKKSDSRVIAYYFHRTRRCVTCTKLEQYSDEAIRQGFGDELKSGTLVWKSVNIEESPNQHFEEDYGLHTQSLILVRMADGKQKSWKNLDKIWELVGAKEVFVRYVQEELTAYLAGNS